MGYVGKFYKDFSIGIDLKPQKDFLRTWTVKLENQERLIINGLGLIHSFALLEVTRKF